MRHQPLACLTAHPSPAPPPTPPPPQALLLSKDALKALAAYHILPEGMRTTQLSDGQQLPTLAKDPQARRKGVLVGLRLGLRWHRKGGRASQ